MEPFENPLFTKLKEEFDSKQAGFDDDYSHTLENVETEEWSNGHLYNIEPFDFQRLGFETGKKLKSIPQVTKSKYCYSFDSKGNLLMIRNGLSLPNQFMSTFIFRFEDYFKSRLYGNTKRLINMKHYNCVNNLLIETFMIGNAGLRKEEYNYVSDSVTKICVFQKNGNNESSFEVDFLYTSDGMLKSITNVHPNGYEEIRYSK
jgi:hypothetical protein